VTTCMDGEDLMRPRMRVTYCTEEPGGLFPCLPRYIACQQHSIHCACVRDPAPHSLNLSSRIGPRVRLGLALATLSHTLSTRGEHRSFPHTHLIFARLRSRNDQISSHEIPKLEYEDCAPCPFRQPTRTRLSVPAEYRCSSVQLRTRTCRSP
jgi:hypothetical protein